MRINMCARTEMSIDQQRFISFDPTKKVTEKEDSILLHVRGIYIVAAASKSPNE